MFKFAVNYEVSSEMLEIVNNVVGQHLPKQLQGELQKAIATGESITVDLRYNALKNPVTTAKALSAGKALTRILDAFKKELPALVEAGQALAKNSKIEFRVKLPGQPLQEGCVGPAPEEAAA